MGLTDTVSSIADAAAGITGASDDKAGPKPDAGTPEYTRKDPLDTPDNNKPLTVGPNGNNTSPNAVQTPAAIEFVHFGKVLAEMSDHFPHGKFDNEQGQTPNGRAILFRDALEREAILLHGFITATRTVQQEYKKNLGAAGMLAGAVGTLLGSSGSEPSPGSLKSLLNDITTVGDTINTATADYIKVHKAGIDLHQTRSDYVKFCEEKINPYYLDKKDDAGTALLTSVPGVAGPAKTIFGILLKAFDIYFGMFLNMRKAYEPSIEDACCKFSIDTVTNYSSNTFSPWYPLPDAPDDTSSSSGILAGAENTLKTVKKDIKDTIGAENPAPGLDTITAIFDILGKGSGDDKPPENPTTATQEKPKVKPADELVCRAFATILGKKDADKPPDPSNPPDPNKDKDDNFGIGFMKTPICKVVWGNVEFLKEIYLKLCKDSTKKIDQEWLDATAASTLLDRLYGFIEDNISFIKDAENYKTDVQGTSVGTQKLVDKGKDALADKLGSYADIVVKRATVKLSDQLEALRSAASKNKTLTMEVFLAQLPYLLAFQVRNTTFPLWDLLVDQLLGGKNAAVAAALKPIVGFIGDVKEGVDRTKKVEDQYDKDQNSPITAVENFSTYKDLVTKSTDDGGGKFPGGARTTACTGNQIAADDPGTAEKDRKDNWPS